MKKQLLAVMLSAAMIFASVAPVNAGVLDEDVIIEETDEIINEADGIIDDTDEIIDDTDEIIDDTDEIIDEAEEIIDDTDALIDEADESVGAEISVGDFVYAFIDSEDYSKGVTVTKYNGSATDIIVPSSVLCNGIEYPVKEIYGYFDAKTSSSSGAFMNKNTITSVTLPETVDKIGDCAFFSCYKLESVNLQNISSIGFSTFNSCYKLTGVSIPNVTSLGDHAFSSCYEITSLSIPNVTSIGNSTFKNCRELASIEAPKVTSIGESAFLGCFKLTSINIPDISTIGEYTFGYCKSLTSVTIPESVTTIGKYAFQECSGLTNISLPNVSTIGEYAFSNCTGLTNVTMPNVSTIMEGAFKGCTSLENAEMPSIKTLTEAAFKYCTGLKNVLIGEQFSSFVDGTIDYAGGNDEPAFRYVGTSENPVKLVNKSYLDNPTSSTEEWCGGHFILTFAADKTATTNGSFSLSSNGIVADDHGNLNYLSKDSVVSINTVTNEGYELVRILVKDKDNTEYTVTQNGDDYEFTMPDKNVKVKAIIKKTLSDADFVFNAPSNRLPGKASNANVVCKKSGAGDITVYYSKDKTDWTTEVPSEPGVYYVAADITEGDKYAPATKITGESWKVRLYYEITFNANGGKGTMYTDKALSNDYDLPELCEFSAPYGYHFVGWSTTTDKADIISSPYTVNADTTLYACWSENEHTVTFDAADGAMTGDASRTITFGETYGSLPTAAKDNYVFMGWFTSDGVKIIPESVFRVDEDITLTARYRSAERKMTVDDIAEVFEYTGKAITPEPVVFNGGDELKKGVDYTVKYINNVNAANKDAKDTDGNSIAPTVIVTGKGNFSGTIQKTFSITRRSLTSATADDLTARANDNEQKLKPVVKYAGTKLTLNKDYTLTYSGDCIHAGDYTITITGINNYEGTKTVNLTLTDKDSVPTSKLSVTYPKRFNYIAGTPQKPSSSDIVVKNGTKKLTEGTDYSIEWNDDDYIKAGTHTFDIVGKNTYAGKKTCRYTIKGVKISSAKMDAIKVTYTGSELTPEVNLSRKINGKTEPLKIDEDYTIVSYSNNVNKGTGKIVIEGTGLYFGKVTKKFKIEAASVKDINISAESSTAYEKNGAKPDVRITYNGMLLKEGTDYKLSYKNNKKAGTDSNKAKVIIKGLKNYKDSVYKEYTVTETEIGTSLILVDDLIAGSDNTVKLGTPSLSILEKGTGKKLSASDYDKSQISYTRNGTVIDKNTVLSVGDEVQISVPGKGNYTGIIETSIKVITKENSISKAKAKIDDQTFTGDGIVLTASDITLKMKSTDETAISSSSYEIVEGSYLNNVKKGTASLYVRGKNDKGGLLKVTFKIKAQP